MVGGQRMTSFRDSSHVHYVNLCISQHIYTYVVKLVHLNYFHFLIYESNNTSNTGENWTKPTCLLSSAKLKMARQTNRI